MTFTNEMSPELKQLLIIASCTLPAGLIGGLLLRKLNPGLCKSYTKTCHNRKWWLFLIGLIMFTGLSVTSFYTGRPYHGTLFIAFALLQGFTLVKYGFKRLSPELEAKIDATDFSQIFPRLQLNESKKVNKAEEPTPNPPSD